MEPIGHRSRSFPVESDASASQTDGSELVCREPAASVNECREEEVSLACQSPAVRSLVERHTSAAPLPAPAPEQARGGATPPSDNNAHRTMQRDSLEPYAASGRTANGDGWFAGAAAVKTRDPRTGLDAELLTGSAQVGKQNELQAGVMRVGFSSGEPSGWTFSASAEAMTVRANAGIHNDDGSHGANLGAIATGAGIEATIGYSGWSVTAGVSLSAGGAASSGERNIDGDDVPERCFKVSYGPTTLGFCSEL